MSMTSIHASSTMQVFVKEPVQLNQQEGVARRAAFDLGGGSIRGLVADVEPKTGRLVRELFNGKIELPFRATLTKEKELPLRIQEEAFKALMQLVEEMSQYQPEGYQGIATEAFRLAPNGRQFIKTISQKSGVPIRVIEQDEEGRLGFLAATKYTDASIEDIVVVDNGTGSLQISTLKPDRTFDVGELKLGRIKIDERIFKRRGLEPSGTVNPVSSAEALDISDTIGQELNQLSSYLKEKMASKKITVIGSFDLVCEEKIWKKERAWTLLSSCYLNQTDDGIKALGSVPHDTSRAILVYSILKNLNVNEIKITGTDARVGSTPGVLTSEEYWKDDNKEVVNY